MMSEEGGLPGWNGGGISPLAQLKHLLAQANSLAETRWLESDDSEVEELLFTVEQVRRRFDRIQIDLTTLAERSGGWAERGFRSVVTWLQSVTGSSRVVASRGLDLSRALRSDLPQTSRALGAGEIGREHAQILQREATKTEMLRAQLDDPEMGEAFLLDLAPKLSVDDFRRAVKHWATLADPEAAERNWREESAQEEVFLSAVGDSYYLSGRLNKVSGRALEVALTAQMGRKAEGDGRSPASRRAAALVSWAHAWLDSGQLMPNARIRPHLSVHVPYETLAALCEATGSAIPASRGLLSSISQGNSSVPPARFPAELRPWNAIGDAAQGPSGNSWADRGDSQRLEHEQAWVDAWRPGSEHVISSTVDFSRIRGAPPATMDDGTAIPPTVLARIACGSSLTRIVFGPQSTILDVGRQQRIFPANQTRAIIARDRHCQFPSCSEPPEFGEIHHSLWWWKHNGKTSTDQGILLCWHHHAYVHEQNITIAWVKGEWVFSTEFGETIQCVRRRSSPVPLIEPGAADSDAIAAFHGDRRELNSKDSQRSADYRASDGSHGIAKQRTLADSQFAAGSLGKENGEIWAPGDGGSLSKGDVESSREYAGFGVDEAPNSTASVVDAAEYDPWAGPSDW